MTKMTLGTHPYLLGFDQLERLAERAAKGAEGYPPYNIEHRAPDGFRITLASNDFTLQLRFRKQYCFVAVRGRAQAGGLFVPFRAVLGGLSFPLGFHAARDCALACICWSERTFCLAVSPSASIA